jgi:hypothetical protein
VKTGRRIREGCCPSYILFNLHDEYLNKQDSDGLVGQLEKKVNPTLKYAVATG